MTDPADPFITPEPLTLVSRIKQLFRGRANLPVVSSTSDVERIGAPPARSPQNAQQMIGSMMELMGTIRDNLERQNQRQDELLQHLAQLPQVIAQLPESNRVQGETLKAIHQQIGQQNQQQAKLGEILDRIVEASGQQRSSLDALNDQVDTLRQQDQTIADKLGGVSRAMESVSHSSTASAQVLLQLQGTLGQRDEAIERILHRHTARFNFIFYFSIIVAITMMLTVIMLSYLLIRK